jgi:hypothetical protein
MSFTDLMRHVLRLPWESQMERPTIPPEWEAEAFQFAQNHGIRSNESVLLFPANSSPLPQIPDIFWETVAKRMREHGLSVFTNMKGGNVRPKTMPIADTTPVEVPIHLALPLVRLAGRTICSPNGMQFLQLLGGRFRQMTVAMPMDRQLGDWEMNARLYCAVARMQQFVNPELCLDAPMAEFAVPYDGTDEELTRIAIAIADESFEDPSCLQRTCSNGRSYVDQHRDWLSALVQPVVG